MLRESGDIPTETDVLVIGSGIAGHSAALAAAEEGAKVLLLEKSENPGGSSAMAGGGFAFSGTDLMEAAGQEDSLEQFRKDIFEAGKQKNDPAMVDRFLNDQLEAFNFLKRQGVKFELHPTAKRVHLTGTGRAVSNLHAKARSHENITYFSKSTVMQLRRSKADGPVDTAICFFGDREVEVTAKRGIVITSGGFSRSRELLGIFAPELLNAVKHGGVANTGDGLIMASALGGGLTDLGYVRGSFGGVIRNYPHGEQGADEVPPLLFAYLEGGILVNKNGKRFVKEDQNYKLISNVGMEQPDGVGFQLFDQKLLHDAMADSSVNNYKEGIGAGYIRQADTIAELAESFSIDPAVLEETVERYNKFVDAGKDADFGREANLMKIDTPPYLMAPSANALTSTYGGITTDGEMQVTDWLGEPIDGLFAAGEVVGGFHGAGYYSASSLSSSTTFGMYAGRKAAHHTR